MQMQQKKKILLNFIARGRPMWENLSVYEKLCLESGYCKVIDVCPNDNNQFVA